MESKLRIDVLDVLESGKDCLDNAVLRGDIVDEIVRDMNDSGSYTFDRAEAVNSISKYIDEDFSLVSDIVLFYKEQFGMDISSKIFTNPEIFQVLILIEGATRALKNNSSFVQFVNEGGTIGEDVSVINRIIDNVIEKLEDSNVQYWI